MNKRLLIVGPPGAGKTKITKSLSHYLKINSYYLDDMYWDKGWRLRENILEKYFERATLIHGDWIIDGYYEDSIDELYKLSTHTFVIKVNYLKMFYRLLKRSYLRLLTKERICGENKESAKSLFSRGGLFHHAHKQFFFFSKMKKKYKNIVYVKNVKQIICQLEL